MEALWITAFCAAAALMFMAYVGYPLLLWRLAKPARTSPQTVAQSLRDWSHPDARTTHLPAPDSSHGVTGLRVAVVLVVKNEAARIEARLRNLLDCSTAIEELIVVCDGCTDDTAERARAVDHAAIQVLEVSEAKGKPAGVNLGIATTTADVVVLCDARQRFDSQAIPNLVRWFADAETGAVSGALEIDSASSASGQGVDAYWRLEKAIRQWESDLDSSVGCTGAIYAVRRVAYEPMPEDTLLDDVVAPMMIAAKGYRVRFDTEALAFDPQQLGGSIEQRRKQRTLAGNFQMLARYASWMLPSGHRLWWKLILHKYLRLAGPLLIVVAFVASMMLCQHTIFLIATLLQVAFGLLALAGSQWPTVKSKALSLPAGFMFLQWCVVLGFIAWITAANKKGWR